MEKKANPDKILVLVRHAHRDIRPSDFNNGLSERGMEQAARLARHFQERFGATQAIVLSSPKLRCLQTAQAIADASGTELEIDERLDEQRAGETPSQFQKRIKDFVKAWKAKPPKLMVACSHADWLPLAFGEILGRRLDLEKGGWAEIAIDGDEVRLDRLEQEP